MMKKIIPTCLLLSATVLLGACDGDDDDLDFSEDLAQARLNVPLNAIFNPAEGAFFYPNDAVLGRLSALAPEDDPSQTVLQALDQIDGHSLINPIVIPLTRLPTAEPDVCSVRIFGQDDTGAWQAVPSEQYQLAVTPVPEALQGELPGVQAELAILPVVPIMDSTRYIIALTDQLQTDNGTALSPAGLYGALIHPSVDPSAEPNLSQLALFRDSFQQAYGIASQALAGSTDCSSAQVVTAWQATGQSVISGEQGLFKAVIDNATEAAARDGAGAPALRLVDTGQTLGAVLGNSALPGASARVHVGAADLLDYQSGNSLADETWRRSNGELARNDDTTTPDGVSVRVPALAVLPENGSAPYPVAMFVHGITSDRSAVLGVAGALAANGIATLAVDLPTHGIVDSDNPLHASALARLGFGSVMERHQNTDLDGEAGVDASGSYFYVFSHPLTTRSHLRQAVADQIMLRRLLPRATLVQPDGSAQGDLFDPSAVSYIGHSLGGIVGSVYAAVEASDWLPEAFVLNVPGGGLAQTFLVSETFAPVLAEGLAAQGIVAPADIANFALSNQVVVDAIDPINHMATAVSRANILMLNVEDDAVIPNDGLSAGLALVGSDPLARELLQFGQNDHHWQFAYGSHSSLFQPQPQGEPASAASVEEIAVTAAMQQANVQAALSTVANDFSRAQLPAQITVPGIGEVPLNSLLGTLN